MRRDWLSGQILRIPVSLSCRQELQVRQGCAKDTLRFGVRKTHAAFCIEPEDARYGGLCQTDEKVTF